MNHRFLVIAFATMGLTALVGLAGACSGTGESSRAPAEDIGQATAAITAVPPMVGCIEIDVTGVRSVSRRFDVTPGNPAVLTLTGLPLGSDTFVGLAYPSACAGVMSTTQATWISDPVVATLVPQAVASVSLTLRPNGQASVGVGFQPDEAGTPCMMPLVSCAGVCVDTASDPNNCGACGNVCSPGSACVAGVCACPAGLTQCASGCVNLTADNNNCGACGTVCPAGAACATAGMPPVTACTCPAGESVCGGACANTATDPLNCGACGHMCPAGDKCTAGVCTASGTCTPRTCAQEGIQCGGAGDGCGGVINCGTCPFLMTCGGGMFGQCGLGTCIPQTCAGQGFNCGPASDGCGNIIQCGACPAGQVCGGGGKPNVCG